MRERTFLAILGVGALILTGFTLKDSPEWTTRLRLVQQDRISESPDSMRGRSFGSATWKLGETPTTSVVDLTFTYGGEERNLSWAILIGRCRTASLPIAPVSSFPEIEVTGGGAARVTATLPVELPRTGQYHIDVYNDRSGEEGSIVACGDLRFSAKG
jgi:hypothetical protein